VALCLHPRILPALPVLSLLLCIRCFPGSQLACGPGKYPPGAGWRGPQATERRSVPPLSDRVLILHDNTEPGREAVAGEAGTSNAVRAAAARRSRAGMNAL